MTKIPWAQFYCCVWSEAQSDRLLAQVYIQRNQSSRATAVRRSVIADDWVCVCWSSSTIGRWWSDGVNEWSSHSAARSTVDRTYHVHDRKHVVLDVFVLIILHHGWIDHDERLHVPLYTHWTLLSSTTNWRSQVAFSRRNHITCISSSAHLADSDDDFSRRPLCVLLMPHK